MNTRQKTVPWLWHNRLSQAVYSVNKLLGI